MDYIDKFKQAALSRLKSYGFTDNHCEQLYDLQMDKMALELLEKKAIVTNMDSNVGGPGNAARASLANPMQTQHLRSILNRRQTNIPGQTGDIVSDKAYLPPIPRVKAGEDTKVNIVTDNELKLCKAAFICKMAMQGITPFEALKLFAEQLEKHADSFISDIGDVGKDIAHDVGSVGKRIKEVVTHPFANMHKPTEQGRYMNFFKRMQNTAAANSQGAFGFTPQDELSKQRINAVINGLVSIPTTTATAAVEGVKRIAK